MRDRKVKVVFFEVDNNLSLAYNTLKKEFKGQNISFSHVTKKDKTSVLPEVLKRSDLTRYDINPSDPKKKLSKGMQKAYLSYLTNRSVFLKRDENFSEFVASNEHSVNVVKAFHSGLSKKFKRNVETEVVLFGLPSRYGHPSERKIEHQLIETLLKKINPTAIVVPMSGTEPHIGGTDKMFSSISKKLKIPYFKSMGNKGRIKEPSGIGQGALYATSLFYSDKAKKGTKGVLELQETEYGTPRGTSFGAPLALGAALSGLVAANPKSANWPKTQQILYASMLELQADFVQDAIYAKSDDVAYVDSVKFISDTFKDFFENSFDLSKRLDKKEDNSKKSFFSFTLNTLDFNIGATK